MRGLTQFEHRQHPVISRQRFAHRMAWALTLWFTLTLAGLLIGMAGYAGIVGMNWDDAFVNAAMILSGMGPIETQLQTTAAKLFAGGYAIISGLIIVVATAFILAPIFHRILHRFHVETDRRD